MSLSARRAWIEICAPKALRPGRPSLSARRAWIEMIPELKPLELYIVALRKESVDRNQAAYLGAGGAVLSLSARRAWIEIVDCLWDEMSCSGRSPQGERG